MPKFTFALENEEWGATEVFASDQEAKLHACAVADELNRNADRPCRVMIFGEDGVLLAVVPPSDE